MQIPCWAAWESNLTKWNWFWISDIHVCNACYYSDVNGSRIAQILCKTIVISVDVSVMRVHTTLARYCQSLDQNTYIQYIQCLQHKCVLSFSHKKNKKRTIQSLIEHTYDRIVFFVSPIVDHSAYVTALSVILSAKYWCEHWAIQCIMWLAFRLILEWNNGRNWAENTMWTFNLWHSKETNHCVYCLCLVCEQRTEEEGRKTIYLYTQRWTLDFFFHVHFTCLRCWQSPIIHTWSTHITLHDELYRLKEYHLRSYIDTKWSDIRSGQLWLSYRCLRI